MFDGSFEKIYIYIYTFYLPATSQNGSPSQNRQRRMLGKSESSRLPSTNHLHPGINCHTPKPKPCGMSCTGSHHALGSKWSRGISHFTGSIYIPMLWCWTSFVVVKCWLHHHLPFNQFFRYQTWRNCRPQHHHVSTKSPKVNPTMLNHSETMLKHVKTMSKWPCT